MLTFNVFYDYAGWRYLELLESCLASCLHGMVVLLSCVTVVFQLSVMVMLLSCVTAVVVFCCLVSHVCFGVIVSFFSWSHVLCHVVSQLYLESRIG